MRIQQTTVFKKQVKLMKKRGANLNELKALIEHLTLCQPLPQQYKDHALSGNWSGFRDCHIRPDWLLIYQLESEKLILRATGSHADLFGL